MSGTTFRGVRSVRAQNSVYWIVFLVAVWGASSAMGGGENELLSKHDWSVLQSVEYRYRESPSGEHLLLVEQWGKHFAGVLSTQGSQRIWILLDPDHRPFVKQLPKGDYHINSTEFERISAFSKLHPEVQSALKQSARATPNAK
jgi:hypothetical protein